MHVADGQAAAAAGLMADDALVDLSCSPQLRSGTSTYTHIYTQSHTAQCSQQVNTHSFAMAGMSTQRRYGLVGDSLKNSDTLCCSSARSRPLRSEGSITVQLMPIFGSTV